MLNCVAQKEYGTQLTQPAPHKLGFGKFKGYNLFLATRAHKSDSAKQWST